MDVSNPSFLNAIVAFLFGVLSFFSPCVLPLLPGYFSLIAGTGMSDNTKPSRYRAVWLGTGFVAGFSVLFIGLGAAASGIGQWLISNQEILMRVAGVIIIIFGLHISELLPIKLLYRQTQWQVNHKFTGWIGAFFMGFSFAAGWTPCVGPVLASILLLAGSSETLTQGVLLLALFSLGLGIPFILAALGIDYIYRGLVKMNRILPYVNAVSGGLLIAMGILMLLGVWYKLMLFVT